MSRLTEVQMQVRPQDVEWNPTAPDAYVVRLTDQGWKHFSDHGFPPESRAYLNDASSLMFLDFEDRVGLVAGHEMRKRLASFQKSQRSLLEKIDEIQSKIRSHELDDSSLLELRPSMVKSIKHLESQKKGPWRRLRRDPVYNYVGRLRWLSDILGRPLTRTEKSNTFLKITLRMHADPLFEYLTQTANIPASAARIQTGLLRHQSPEGAIRRRSTGTDVT